MWLAKYIPHVSIRLTSVYLWRHMEEPEIIHYLTGNRRKIMVRGTPIGHLYLLYM